MVTTDYLSITIRRKRSLRHCARCWRTNASASRWGGGVTRWSANDSAGAPSRCATSTATRPHLGQAVTIYTRRTVMGCDQPGPGKGGSCGGKSLTRVRVAHATSPWKAAEVLPAEGLFVDSYQRTTCS